MKLNNDLIQKAKDGDIDSLEQLLKITEKEVYSTLYFLTRSNEELSDIVQEILLKVSNKINTLKDTHLYKSWLNKIVIRQYYDTLRKNKNKCSCADDISEINENDENLKDTKEPIDYCMGCELANIIKMSVCKLNEPYRLALIMREFEGLSYDEIANLTRTNVGTVKSRIARARSQMKEYIKPYME